MSTTFWLIFVSFLCFGIISTGKESLGQVLDGESQNQKLTDLITNLCLKQTESNNKISKLTKSIEALNLRLSDLDASSAKVQDENNQRTAASTVTQMDDRNVRILERLSKLETLMESVLTKQNAMESQILNQTNQLLQNHLSLSIASCSTPTVSGVFKLRAPNVNVFCEAKSYGGRWLYIQRRFNGELSFDRNWYFYRSGFGKVGPESEFWLGLEAIHQITNDGGDYELNVVILNESRDYKYARYSKFRVAGEEQGYKLTIDGYSGTAGDNFSIHNGMRFSTYDEDNDRNSDKNCAKEFTGGWWFNNCGKCNLNGPYNKASNAHGIEWGEWAKQARDVRMMIRRK